MTGRSQLPLALAGVLPRFNFTCMDPGTSTFLVVACVIVVAIAAILLFRFIIRRLGAGEMVNNGIVLTENGIEFSRFLFMGRSKVSYADIESVEIVPFPRNLTLRMRYGPSVASYPGASWNLYQDTLAIKLKQPCTFQYHLFHPMNPAEVAEKLRSRIESPSIDFYSRVRSLPN